MTTGIDLKNPVEVLKAGYNALNEALGYDGTLAFMEQVFSGSGDYTKEKYERTEPSFEEVTAELRRIDAEMRASGLYDKQKKGNEYTIRLEPQVQVAETGAKYE